MAYAENKEIDGLTALTSIADGDYLIFGDISDANETAKSITWANFKTLVTTHVEGLASYFNVSSNTLDDITTGSTNVHFTATDNTKLDGIETAATADQTGAEIKTAYEAEANTNAYTDAEKTKLAGIEASADVTDATNVNAAGAVMESDYTAKGALLTASASGVISELAVGTNDYVLTADSTQPGGIKWASNPAGFSDPMTTRGDVIVRDATNTTARLAIGTNGQVLTSDGTDISWSTPAGTGDVVKVGTPADSQIGVWTGDGTIEGDTALTFDTATDTLAVGASGKLNFGAVNILSDSAGTTTLANIDAVDSTTSTTIASALGITTGLGQRVVVVAASNAADGAGADYTCDGTADEVQINAALADVKAAGGKVVLTDGTFNCAAAVALVGNAANDDDNPQITLHGAGIDATTLNMATGINGIELTQQPKYDIGYMTIAVLGAANAIDQQAGTERGNWQSNIHDIFIKTDFATHTGWGIMLESPFRMRFENIEMNGVANGMWLTSHVESFNPGNLSCDRLFIDLWNDASNASAIGLKLSVLTTTSTGHFNLTHFNRVDIAGGSALTSSIGIQLVGATGSYGECRQHDFNNLNIEDVQTAIQLIDASDNTFTNINYTRVLNNGTVFDCNSESLNNKFENTYLDSNTAGLTVLVIDDDNTDTAQPNIFSRIVGYASGTTTLNGTITGATVIEHVDLAEGSPTVDADLTERHPFMGNVQFRGTYDENSTVQSVQAGYSGGTPRILFANGTAAQNWQIDNNGGDFRWYTPGNTVLTMEYGPNRIVPNGELAMNGQNITDVHEVRLDAVPDTDHTANGATTNSINASGTITAFTCVYLDASGTWTNADASATATADKLLAIALEAGSVATPMKVALPGSFVRDDTWTWTVGGAIYLSETTGALTQTAPTTTDSVVRTLGYAVSADVMYFNPETGVVHA